MAETNLGKVRMTDGELEKKINEILGGVGTGGGYTILWENPSPYSNFAKQTVTLEESLENYAYYEVLYLGTATENSNRLSTGKVAAGTGNRAILQYIYIGSGVNMRVATCKGDKVEFSDNTQYASITNTSSTVQVGRNIPIQILGYK